MMRLLETSLIFFLTMSIGTVYNKECTFVIRIIKTHTVLATPRVFKNLHIFNGFQKKRRFRSACILEFDVFCIRNFVLLVLLIYYFTRISIITNFVFLSIS